MLCRWCSSGPLLPSAPLSVSPFRPMSCAPAAPISASTETCAFCSSPGHSYLRHAFPFEAISAPVLSSPLCVAHLALAQTLLLTSPSEFLAQLPAESAEQRSQRTHQEQAYAALMADPKSPGAAWLADPSNTAREASQCRVCRLNKSKPAVQHAASDLHTLRCAPQRRGEDQVGRATMLPPAMQRDLQDTWCAAHVWDAVRLMQHWDPRENAGKGNVRSWYLDNRQAPF